ncbi:MAG: hypothetical protein ACUVRD_05540 [Bacteroidia bacterium]
MRYLSILAFVWAQSQGVWKATMRTPSYTSAVQGWVGDAWLYISSDIQTDTSTSQMGLLGKEKQLYLIDPRAKAAYEIPSTAIKALSPASVEELTDKKNWQGKEIRRYRLQAEGWQADVWWLAIPFSIRLSDFIHQEILGHAFMFLPSGLPVEITAHDTEGKTLLTWKLESWQTQVPPAQLGKIPYPVKRFSTVEIR